MRHDLSFDLPRPKREKKLPDVLSPEEVMALLGGLANKKHRAILSLVYSAGLRVSEVVRLQVADIDKERMVIHIRQAKGKKDRFTLLSHSALEILREYVRDERPDKWLFPSQGANLHLSKRSVQKIFEKAVLRVGIRKKELLGHQSSKTTEIYTHVSIKDARNLQSPLDRLLFNQQQTKSN